MLLQLAHKRHSYDILGLSAYLAAMARRLAAADDGPADDDDDDNDDDDDDDDEEEAMKAEKSAVALGITRVCGSPAASPACSFASSCELL